MSFGLADVEELAKGVERSSQNVFGTMIAMEKLNKDKEVFDLDQKVKNLQLNKLEGELSPERMKSEQEKLKAEAKLTNVNYDLKTQELDTTKKTNQRQAFMQSMLLEEMQKSQEAGQGIPARFQIDEKGLIKTTKPIATRERIISKVASGESLTSGEEKIFDEVLAKKQQGQPKQETSDFAFDTTRKIIEAGSFTSKGEKRDIQEIVSVLGEEGAARAILKKIAAKTGVKIKEDDPRIQDLVASFKKEQEEPKTEEFSAIDILSPQLGLQKAGRKITKKIFG